MGLGGRRSSDDDWRGPLHLPEAACIASRAFNHSTSRHLEVSMVVVRAALLTLSPDVSASCPGRTASISNHHPTIPPHEEACSSTSTRRAQPITSHALHLGLELETRYVNAVNDELPDPSTALQAEAACMVYAWLPSPISVQPLALGPHV